MKNYDQPFLSLVIPTYNEAGNLEILLQRIAVSMESRKYEVVIVDDNSPDGTGDKAEALSDLYPMQVVHRSGKKGLASAVIEGFGVAKGNVLGCIDADLSHPPEVIPKLLSAITDEGMDMVVASRLIEGGGVVGNCPQKRRLNSYVATLMAKPLTSVLDSMSGCFLLRKQVIENVKLVPRGYKIGLEILVKGNCPKVGEIPILFDNRMTGTSKLSPKTQFEYMIQIGCLYAHKIKKMILRKH